MIVINVNRATLSMFNLMNLIVAHLGKDWGKKIQSFGYQTLFQYLTPPVPPPSPPLLSLEGVHNRVGRRPRRLLPEIG